MLIKDSYVSVQHNICFHLHTQETFMLSYLCTCHAERNRQWRLLCSVTVLAHSATVCICVTSPHGRVWLTCMCISKKCNISDMVEQGCMDTWKFLLFHHGVTPTPLYIAREPRKLTIMFTFMSSLLCSLYSINLYKLTI